MIGCNSTTSRSSKCKPSKSKKANRQNQNEYSTPAALKDVRVRVVEDNGGSIWQVALPATADFALTMSSDGSVRKWDLTIEEFAPTIFIKQALRAIATTADGSYAAFADIKGQIHVTNFSRYDEVISGQADLLSIRGLTFVSEKLELLSACNDGVIRRWNAVSRNLISECKLPFKRLSGIAASADGRRIVGAAGNEGLAMWSGLREDKATLYPKSNLASTAPISVSADGKLAFTGTKSGQVVVWSLDEGRQLSTFEGHRGEVTAIASTPNARFCVSGGQDNSVRLWAVETGQCIGVFRGHFGEVTSVAITSDARRIVSASTDHALGVWDIPPTVLARADVGRRRGYINAKIVLVGDSGAGKTGLALRLWHNRWAKTESSHGMEIHRLRLPGTRGDEGIEREVWLWDLAGQPDYRLTHQLFMEQTSLALLVFDPQSSSLFDTIKYWQSALSKVARGKNLSGILVAGRCDRPGLRLTMDELQAWAQSRGLHGPILTAAKVKKHPGVAELHTLIAELLPWDTMEFRSTMENFPALKNAILAVRDSNETGGIVVKPKELESRVRRADPQLSFTSDDLLTVTELLAGEGVLYALPYGELVVLQPSWVNCYASKLIKLAGEDKSKLGHVSLAAIQPGMLPEDGTPRLSLEDEMQLLPALVALFLERALAWKQNTDKGEMLVFPNYVRLPRSEPPPRPGRTVLYRFCGPLEEIYCTLVVRLHYSGLFDSTKLYRQAVDFRTATGKLVALTMQEDGERGELEVYFATDLDPDVQASFQQFVHDHLIGPSAKTLNLERLRNFFCPKCNHENTDRKAIDAALSKTRSKIVCAYCDPEDHPGLIDLNDVLERQFANRAGEQGADQARRIAGEGISTASMEQVMVGEVMALVASADQVFIPRVVRDEGTDGEIEFFTIDRESSGVAFRVQLKSGDSHLKQLKDGTERFPMKKHYERYWAGEKTVPVLLIVRNSDGRTRYMNATKVIREAQKRNPGKPVRRIAFVGEDFTREAVLRLRDERLAPAKQASLDY